MKRFAAMLLTTACLLTGCGSQASLEDVTTLPAAPAAAQTQTLNIYCDSGDTGALQQALQAYCDAQNVTPQWTDDLAGADLALLSALPEGEGWTDLSGQPMLAAAAERAGLATDAAVYQLPLGRSLYAYWADGTVLSALLGENSLTDLQNATWQEWSDFAAAVTTWLDTPAQTTLTLNGNSYTLPAQRPEAAANLEGVFAVCGGTPTAAWAGPAYTSALLAAGDQRTDAALTGPLNGVYAAFTLELSNCAGAADRTRAEAAQALQQGQALFFRASLTDLVSALGKDAIQNYVAVPFKCNFDESDLTTESYNLNGLMNYPILANAGYLAVPAGGNADAAESAILWIYASGAGNTVLTDDLLLVTPWNTASNATAIGAMQVEQVGTGILPEVALTAGQNDVLYKTGQALMESSAFTTSTRTAFVTGILPTLRS